MIAKSETENPKHLLEYEVKFEKSFLLQSKIQ
jgi:hypothetical protein